jgi:hypothetical protein
MDRKYCVICGLVLNYDQKVACSMKHFHKHQENIRIERIKALLLKLEGWASMRYIKTNAGNMDYNYCVKTVNLLIKEKIVESIKTTTGQVYRLRRD